MEQFVIDDRYITKKIRKSTFKIKATSDNAFIDDSGNFHEIDSMHHNQWALEELNRLHDEHVFVIRNWESRIAVANRRIEVLNNCPEGVPLPESILDLGWICRYYSDDEKMKGGRAFNEAMEFAKNYIELYEGFLKSAKEDGDELEMYKKMHKNIGIDPAEFLVAELGYTALENGYIIYGDSVSYKFTDEFDLVQDYDEDFNVKCLRPRSDKELAKIREGLIKKASYYDSDPSSRFHCPSGFIRRDYSEFLSKCAKYGVDYRPRSSRYFT